MNSNPHPGQTIYSDWRTMTPPDQPTFKPTPKVVYSSAAGAGSVLLVFVLGQFGVNVPPEAAAAITTLLTFLAGYLKRG